MLVVVALTKLGGGKCELYFPEQVNKATNYGQVSSRGVLLIIKVEIEVTASRKSD